MTLTLPKINSSFDLSYMISLEKLELLIIIGKRIQNIRISQGLSQVDLVGKIEGRIDTTNISRIESGRTNPTLFTLYRISEALEVSISELVNTDSTI